MVSSYRVGLIGRGIQRSKSPAMHEAEAAAQGMSCTYELIDLEERGVEVSALASALADLLLEAERRGFAGVNITYPCKQAVIPLLSALSDEARAIGAVNTVKFQDGQRTGYNTDAWGFAESFRRGLRGAALERVVQIGAGGAGAATSYALLGLGARELRLIDVDESRAASLARSLLSHFPSCRVKVVGTQAGGRADTQAGTRAGTQVDALADALATADGVVHATPMGMANHRGTAVPAQLLRPGLWVADIVYFPIETELLQSARAAGCRTLDGGGMAVFQAAKAFEIFTGRSADGERMRRHFASLTQS
jgi:shikimate dehydrogenase